MEAAAVSSSWMKVFGGFQYTTITTLPRLNNNSKTKCCYFPPRELLLIFTTTSLLLKQRQSGGGVFAAHLLSGGGDAEEDDNNDNDVEEDDNNDNDDDAEEDDNGDEETKLLADNKIIVAAAVDNGFTLPSPPPPMDHTQNEDDTVDDFKSSSNTSQDTMSINTSSPAGSGSGSRAGLFRTPISGGVQSATSVHDLPPPPLAVRNLMEQARFAHLCTVMSRMHHRREGYPFGSLVDFATDAMGHPIFSFSPLAIHTRNLLADPRCTLVVQIPGWSGLSNARVTIFGDVFPLPEDEQEWAHKQYIAKHQQGPSQQWGNFYYFRMQNISDIYFIGGFGTVAWVNVREYEALRPDKIAVDGGEQNLKELNAIFSKPLKELLSLETEVDDAALISIDSKGTDVRVRQGAQFNIQRLAFEEGNGVETLEEAKAALWNLIQRGGSGLKFEHKF